jgi:hypothetical protein
LYLAEAAEGEELATVAVLVSDVLMKSSEMPQRVGLMHIIVYMEWV